MSMSACSTTSAQAYQVAQQQLSSERRETIERDHDSGAVAKTRQGQNNQQTGASQTQTAPQVREANKGHNVDYYA